MAEGSQSSVAKTKSDDTSTEKVASANLLNITSTYKNLRK